MMARYTVRAKHSCGWSCEICERDDRIADLLAQLDAANERAEKAERAVAERDGRLDNFRRSERILAAAMREIVDCISRDNAWNAGLTTSESSTYKAHALASAALKDAGVE